MFYHLMNHKVNTGSLLLLDSESTENRKSSSNKNSGETQNNDCSSSTNSDVTPNANFQQLAMTEVPGVVEYKSEQQAMAAEVPVVVAACTAAAGYESYVYCNWAMGTWSDNIYDNPMENGALVE